MRACWTFMILLSCRFSHVTQSQGTCALEDMVHMLCVPVRDSVIVPCPSPTEDVEYKLFKEKEIIFNGTCAPDCTPLSTREGVELHQNKENKSVSFTLTGVNVSTCGVYRCEGTRNYPPPSTPLQSPRVIVVLVEGHQCKVREDYTCNFKTSVTSGQKEFWILISGIILVGIYGLTVSIIAAVIWVKWRNSESQSDYMNTKPKASRDGRKKRGIQMPIPRHF